MRHPPVGNHVLGILTHSFQLDSLPYMKMSKVYIISCITLVVGVGFGFLASNAFRAPSVSVVSASSSPHSLPNPVKAGNNSSDGNRAATSSSESGSKHGRLDIDAMSVSDIQSALGGILGTSGSDRESRLALFRAWARKDANGAWAAAAKQETEAERVTALGAIASALCASNPDAALKLVAGINGVGERAAVMKSALTQWAGSQPSSLLAYLKSHPALIGDSALHSAVLGAASSADPMLTSQYLIGVSHGGLGYYSLDKSMHQWVTANPAAARAWLDTLNDPAQRNRALKAFLSSSALKNPTSYLGLMDSITDRNDLLSVRTNFLANLLRTDTNAALGILKDLPVSELSGAFKYRLAHVLAEMSPQEQDALLKQLPDGLRELAMGRIAENSTRTAQFSRAIDALNAMPEGRERDRAMFDLAVRFSKENAKGALDWINKQPESADRDILNAGYATTLAAKDVNSALKVAIGIPDEAVRRYALRNVVGQWILSSPVEANAWLSATSLLAAPDIESIRRLSQVGRFVPTYPVVVNRR
jgi:hypothetical protein